MGGRKRRGLSSDDQLIWDRLRATVEPLHVVRAASIPETAPAKSLATDAGRVAQVPSKGLAYSLPQAETQTSLPSVAPRMDHRRFEKLRRGLMRPQARIDLHGMTTDRAHVALNGFIGSAYANGLRLVLVITGKGSQGKNITYGYTGHGVLRRSVPHWLAMAPNRQRILEVVQAHRRHGGEGALYVYLARQK